MEAPGVALSLCHGFHTSLVFALRSLSTPYSWLLKVFFAHPAPQSVLRVWAAEPCVGVVECVIHMIFVRPMSSRPAMSASSAERMKISSISTAAKIKTSPQTSRTTTTRLTKRSLAIASATMRTMSGSLRPRNGSRARAQRPRRQLAE